MKLLVMDTETTGLNPKTCLVTEIAAALFDTETNSVVWSVASFVPETEIPGGYEMHSGIRQGMLEATPATCLDFAVASIQAVARWATAAVAHNASFDKPFVDQLVDLSNDKGPLPWICTKDDIEYPSVVKGKRLGYIAVDLGIPMVSWHRAAVDVQTLCNILMRVPNLEEQVYAALQPRAVFCALVPIARKDEAKHRGYTWDPNRKIWWKKLPINTPLEPTEDRPFRIALVEGQ